MLEKLLLMLRTIIVEYLDFTAVHENLNVLSFIVFAKLLKVQRNKDILIFFFLDIYVLCITQIIKFHVILK